MFWRSHVICCGVVDATNCADWKVGVAIEIKRRRWPTAQIENQVLMPELQGMSIATVEKVTGKDQTRAY